MGLCERCKKAQATFHLTNIHPNGAKVERHLCDRCAAEEGLLQPGKSGIDMHDLIQTFVQSTPTQAPGAAHLVCEACGISFVEFRNQGLLGCPADYDAFREQLHKLIERAHGGAAHHVGKSPKSLGAPRAPRQDSSRLRRLLDEAVAAEDYERAAELRDRIRKLEGE